MSLNDTQHVEAVAIMRRLKDAVGRIEFDDDAVTAAEVWLKENHPEPATYISAISPPAELREFGDLGGAAPVMVPLQGGWVRLRPYGCTHCGGAFWTEDDDKRRLPPGPHPCPHCGVQSTVGS